MNPPLPHRRFPTAYFSDQQIAYITDNDRDAEALSCEMESPVVLDSANLGIRQSYSTIVILQKSQTFGTSKRSNARDVSEETEVLPEANALSVPDVRNVPNSPDVQTSNL